MALDLLTLEWIHSFIYCYNPTMTMNISCSRTPGYGLEGDLDNEQIGCCGKIPLNRYQNGNAYSTLLKCVRVHVSLGSRVYLRDCARSHRKRIRVDNEPAQNEQSKAYGSAIVKAHINCVETTFYPRFPSPLQLLLVILRRIVLAPSSLRKMFLDYVLYIIETMLHALEMCLTK